MKEIFELQNLKNMSLAIFDNEELDEQTIKDTQESIVALIENNSASLFSIIKEKEAGIEAMKTLGNYYLEKARKDEVRIKKVKETIKDVMKGLEIKKIQTDIGSFTLRKNNPSLIIDDETPSSQLTQLAKTWADLVDKAKLGKNEGTSKVPAQLAKDLIEKELLKMGQ